MKKILCFGGICPDLLIPYGAAHIAGSRPSDTRVRFPMGEVRPIPPPDWGGWAFLYFSQALQGKTALDEPCAGGWKRTEWTPGA